MPANDTKLTQHGSNRLSLFAEGKQVFTQTVHEAGTHVASQGGLKITATGQLLLSSGKSTVDVDAIARSIELSTKNQGDIKDQKDDIHLYQNKMALTFADIEDKRLADLSTLNAAQALQDAATKTLEDAFSAFKVSEVVQITNQLNLLQKQFNALTGRADETKGKPEESEEPEEALE